MHRAQGDRRHVVSSRSPALTCHGADLIHAVFPGIFTDVLCVRHTESKSATLLRLGSRVFIDDLPQHVFDAERAGVASILFGQTLWNSDIGHVRRASTWRDVLPLSLSRGTLALPVA